MPHHIYLRTKHNGIIFAVAIIPEDFICSTACYFCIVLATIREYTIIFPLIKRERNRLLSSSQGIAGAVGQKRTSRTLILFWFVGACASYVEPQ
jgi:hypothetical protein